MLLGPSSDMYHSLQVTTVAETRAECTRSKMPAANNQHRPRTGVWRCKAAAHLCKYGQRRTRQLRSPLVDGAPDFLISQQQYLPSRPVWLEATSVRNVPVVLASRQTDWWFCWGATGLQVYSGRPLRCKRLSQVGIVLEQQVALGVCAQVAHEPRQQFRNLRHPGKVHPP